MYKLYTEYKHNEYEVNIKYIDGSNYKVYIKWLRSVWERGINKVSMTYIQNIGKYITYI